MSHYPNQPDVYIDYLNRLDVETLDLSDAEILAAIERSLEMQGRGETEIEPRTHIRPRAGAEGHFNVLRGWIGGEIDSAGTKVVGDFVDNYKEGRPSEYGLLTLFDPRNGARKPENPWTYRRARNGLLECALAVPTVRFRRSAYSFASPRKSRGICSTA
jgi:ornithine cyclodeaminase